MSLRGCERLCSTRLHESMFIIVGTSVDDSMDDGFSGSMANGFGDSMEVDGDSLRLVTWRGAEVSAGAGAIEDAEAVAAMVDAMVDGDLIAIFDVAVADAAIRAKM